MSESAIVPGSFRDPNGFVFQRDGQIYRQINRRYQANYDFLIRSGLYDALAQDGLLVPHSEIGAQSAMTPEAYRVIQPVQIPFISYPYEWCFSQLKNAARLILEVQKRALRFEMSLKDASAYNVQFANGKPIFIDTLSFEKYRAGHPWIAYRQFCQHFLAPLALAARRDMRLPQLLRVYLDGIPLDLASALLPFSARLNFGLLSHLHLHARAQKRWADNPASPRQNGLGRTAFLGLLDSLSNTIEDLKWAPAATEWRDYYAFSNYSAAALEAKKRGVSDLLNEIAPAPKMVWDLGGNVGLFSRIASERGMLTISLDRDPAAVEQNYRHVAQARETTLLPLVLDATNPSPGLGWENRERMSLQERGPADLVLALALVHHLALSNNLPFAQIAGFLSQIGRALIIEFIPKNDSQAQKLLANREDIFDEYDQDNFERTFGLFFRILHRTEIVDTHRTLYLMVGRSE